MQTSTLLCNLDYVSVSADFAEAFADAADSAEAFADAAADSAGVFADAVEDSVAVFAAAEVFASAAVVPVVSSLMDTIAAVGETYPCISYGLTGVFLF